MAGTSLSTVGEFGLGIQVWWGPTKFDAGLVRVQSPSLPRWKPGGFFTSSWNEDRQTSDWIDFQAKTCRASEPREAWLLTPDPSATLLVIRSPDDYNRLVVAYPHRYENPRDTRVCPHWRAIAQDERIDAVHMTAEAVSDHNLPYAKAWEVESTLWFRPKLSPLEPS